MPVYIHYSEECKYSVFLKGGRLIHSVFLVSNIEYLPFMVGDVINVYQYCSSKAFAHFSSLATRHNILCHIQCLDYCIFNGVAHEIWILRNAKFILWALLV